MTATLNFTTDYATTEEMLAWARTIMHRKPDFVIGENYLRRWFIVPRNPVTNVYLHEISRSDDDRAMHDHPWSNTSYLLSGRYIEHTPEGEFLRVAGDFVERAATAVHRLELIGGEPAISLFVTGPKVREWGFLCPHGWVHWTKFDPEHEADTQRNEEYTDGSRSGGQPPAQQPWASTKDLKELIRLRAFHAAVMAAAQFAAPK